MKKSILLNIEEPLFETMEKYRKEYKVNRQEFIRTAIWKLCMELTENKKIREEILSHEN